MSNIPLDNMNKRYYNSSMMQDQMNLLNNQMSGMNVTQSGYNKLWVRFYRFFFLPINWVWKLLVYPNAFLHNKKKLVMLQGVESIDLLQCRNVLGPEKVEPPKIKLSHEPLDSLNCSPE